MSKKEMQNTEEKQEKVLTKYDLKMQKRAEEKKKAEREKRISAITGIVVVVALFCLVASFPIRSYLTVNGTYVKVAGESVSRVEFDYNYNMVKNNYVAQYGYYMSMFGIDLTGDLTRQMYSDTLTWQDFFEQMTIDNIIGNKALRDQAKAAGFTYDASKDYAEYEESLRTAAADAGMTEKDYIRQTFGTFATASRLKGYVMEALETGAYYDAVAEEKTPSDGDIQAYYEENKDDYDSVDYRIITVNAELPTEPTELADPVDDAEDTDEETVYQPSEAEIAAAMEIAKAEAEKAEATVRTEGDTRENMKKSDVLSHYRDWLFDSERKAGDTTIVENSSSHLYYVVSFENRYLDQTPTADARVIIVSGDAATGSDAILEEWKSGAATEDSFAEIADKYNDPAVVSAEGGLYEGLLSSGTSQDVADWLFDGARKKGDVTVIHGGEGESDHVLYYVGDNSPEWNLSIKSTLLSQTMTDYMEEVSQGYDVEDPKGNLYYLKVQAAEESEAEDGE